MFTSGAYSFKIKDNDIWLKMDNVAQFLYQNDDEKQKRRFKMQLLIPVHHEFEKLESHDIFTNEMFYHDRSIKKAMIDIDHSKVQIVYFEWDKDLTNYEEKLYKELPWDGALLREFKENYYYESKDLMNYDGFLNDLKEEKAKKDAHQWIKHALKKSSLIRDKML